MAENQGRSMAIFTSSGVTMLSVIKAIYKLKLRVPDDM
jgi:DNA-binding LacI/PurR family transcriptional regulator